MVAVAVCTARQRRHVHCGVGLRAGPAQLSGLDWRARPSVPTEQEGPPASGSSGVFDLYCCVCTDWPAMAWMYCRSVAPILDSLFTGVTKLCSLFVTSRVLRS